MLLVTNLLKAIIKGGHSRFHNLGFNIKRLKVHLNVLLRNDETSSLFIVNPSCAMYQKY